MRVFKRIMELAEKMVDNLQREDSSPQLIAELREIPEDCALLIAKYNAPPPEGSSLKK
jgi:hypothetical protein